MDLELGRIFRHANANDCARLVDLRHDRIATRSDVGDARLYAAVPRILPGGRRYRRSDAKEADHGGLPVAEYRRHRTARHYYL